MATPNVISVYVIAHKQCPIPQLENYVPLLVGAEHNSASFRLRDNVGDNISSLNAEFCELTGQYWIWKNRKTEYAGFVHYRRFFYAKPFSSNHDRIVSSEQLVQDLQTSDLILPKPLVLRTTVAEEYRAYHNGNDLQTVKEVLLQESPEYLKAYDDVMNSHRLYAYNMFVANWDFLDSYFEWFFNILFLLHDRIDTSAYDAYNKRLIGFLAERLLNVWVRYNMPKIKEYPVSQDGQSAFLDQIKNNIKNLLF